MIASLLLTVFPAPSLISGIDIVVILVAMLAGFYMLFVPSALVGHVVTPLAHETLIRPAEQLAGFSAVPSRNNS